MAYTENKKKELSFGFVEETTLRLFVQRKMKALSKYTSLSLHNQLEVILIDLPNEISNLIILKDILRGTKTEILEFCDSIQELVDDIMKSESTTRTITPTVDSETEERNVVQDMEIFEFDENIASDESSVKSKGRGKGLRGRPRKTMKTISEDSESTDDSNQSSSYSTL